MHSFLSFSFPFGFSVKAWWCHCFSSSFLVGCLFRLFAGYVSHPIFVVSLFWQRFRTCEMWRKGADSWAPLVHRMTDLSELSSFYDLASFSCTLDASRCFYNRTDLITGIVQPLTNTTLMLIILDIYTLLCLIYEKLLYVVIGVPFLCCHMRCLSSHCSYLSEKWLYNSRPVTL